MSHNTGTFDHLRLSSLVTQRIQIQAVAGPRCRWTLHTIRTTYIGFCDIRHCPYNLLPRPNNAHLESAGTVGHEGRLRLGHPMGEREFEVWYTELLDVRSADILGLLDLNYTKDLHNEYVSFGTE